MNITDSKKSYLAYIFVISVCYFFACIDIINHSGLNLDELLSWNLAKSPMSELINSIYHDTQQPLYFIFLKLTSYLIPYNSEFGIRIPSLLIGLAFIIIFFNYLNKYFNQITALVITIFLITHHKITYLSTFCRPYILLLLLISINFFSLLEIFFKNKATEKSKNIFTISTLLICLTHYLSLFYFASTFLALFLTKRLGFFKIWGWKRITIITFSFIFIFASLFFQYKYKIYLSWIPSVERNWLDALEEAFIISSYTPLILRLVTGLFLVYFLYKKTKIDDAEKKEVLFLILQFMLGVFSIYLFSIVITPIFIGRYLIIFLPTLAILLSHSFIITQHQKSVGTFIITTCIFIYFIGFKDKQGILKLDEKYFFETIHRLDYIKRSSLVMCNTQNIYPEIFKNYSLIYYPKDICSAYRYHPYEQIPAKFNYIINFKDRPNDAIFNEVLTHYRRVFSTRDLELFERIVK